MKILTVGTQNLFKVFVSEFPDTLKESSSTLMGTVSLSLFMVPTTYIAKNTLYSFGRFVVIKGYSRVPATTNFISVANIYIYRKRVEIAGNGIIGMLKIFTFKQLNIFHISVKNLTTIKQIKFIRQ